LAQSAAAADRSGAKAVIAAKHEREGAFGERRERDLIELLTHLRDLADVFLPPRRAVPAFPDRRRQVALVDHGVAERRDPLAEARAAKRDGPMSTPRRLPPRSSGTPMM
jgi:hypothetical protein